MNTTRCFRLIASLVLGTGIAAAAAPAAAEERGPRLGKVVVFPFESINIDPDTTRAFTEIFSSALRARGVRVLDWRPIHEELYGAADPGGHAPAASSQPQAHVIHGQQGQQVVYLQPAAPAPPARVEPVLRAAAMRAVARKADADAFLQGSLTRLGNQIRVTVLAMDLEGVEFDNRAMDARTEHDLPNVLERLALSLAVGRSVAGTLDLENATIQETHKLPERFRLETHLGLTLGQLFSIGDAMEHLTLMAFDVRLERGSLLVGLNAGMIFAPGGADEDTDVGMLAGVNLACYLTRTATAPYLGAGAGVFFGRVMRPGENTERYSSIGFHASPLVGVEFLRHTRLRVHVDLRWMLVFDSGHDRFGHGPMPLIGINF